MRATFLAAFGEQQLFVGPSVVDQLDMVEVVFTIPMETGAPDVLGGLRIGIDRAGTLHQEVAVVVPDHDLHVAQSGGLQLRPEMIPDEITLFLGAVNARVPTLGGRRLVLHRNAPHGNTAFGIRLDEAHITTRPSVTVLGQQLATVVHLLVGLHPRRRAPGRDQQLDR